MRLIARRYDTAQPTAFEIEAGRIVSAQPVVDPQRNEPGNKRGGNSAHADELPWIAPGLVDLQVNGYGGREFCSPDITVDDIAKIVAVQRSQGVARFLPTVTTSPFEVLRHAMATLAAACDGDRELARHIPGIHLEGPYISPEDGPRGAHPLSQCRQPDWDEFQRLQDAAGGRIRLLTLAPELEGACEFIRRFAATGGIVAIGHTAANSNQIRAAADAGARLSTHLGNGSHRMLRRHPNYLWDQLAEDRLTATVIADGHHLPPEVLKTIVRAKTPERVILISDLSGMAGLAPGRYTTQLCELEILADGRLVLAGQDQLLAGASRPLWTGITNMIRHAEVDLRTAIDMASRRPAELLGLTTSNLKLGEPADIILFHGSPTDDENGLRLAE
jgi:N-acetylglucosamine-6-phosphate deacetylase